MGLDPAEAATITTLILENTETDPGVLRSVSSNIKAKLTARKSKLLCYLETQIDLCPELRAKLEHGLNDDCPLTAECVDIGANEGICLTSCTDSTDCVAGNGCGSGYCLPVPAAWTCDDDYFGDGLCDCGCGVLDSDCENATVAVCDYCDDVDSPLEAIPVWLA